MNLTRCNQGHFFDADKYPTCPHCNPGAPAAAPAATPNADMKTMPLNAVAGGTATMPINQPMNTVPLNPPVNTTPLPDNKTQSGGLRDQVDDVNKTVGFFKKANGKEPVVGWLVCVEGKHYGEDFRIRMGRNFIGRGANMDIVLPNDSSISREKHSIIVYEPQENMYVLLAGESKELSYLNGQVVLSPQLLKPYDKIKLGNTVLMFVPLCGDSFVWKAEEE